MHRQRSSRHTTGPLPSIPPPFGRSHESTSAATTFFKSIKVGRDGIEFYRALKCYLIAYDYLKRHKYPLCARQNGSLCRLSICAYTSSQGERVPFDETFYLCDIVSSSHFVKPMAIMRKGSTTTKGPRLLTRGKSNTAATHAIQIWR